MVELSLLIESNDDEMLDIAGLTWPLGQSVLHDESMNMKIPVRITRRSTPIIKHIEK